MTSEILILNKDCVAMAADSAATLSGPYPKIFETNKVFALSKEYPVGIMIYQSPLISGVPVETLVKEFRSYILADHAELYTIEEYGERFLEFIANGYPAKNGGNIPIITDEAVDAEVRSYFYSIWDEIMNDIRMKAEDSIQNNMNEERVEIVLSPRNIIDNTMADMLSKAERSTRNLKILERRKIRKNIDRICDSEHFMFRMRSLSHPIDPTQYLDRLKNLVCAFICSNEPLPNTTGIVIAGFGQNQTYPAYIEYNIDGYFWGKLKFKEMKRDEIGENRPAIIKTFAQGDVAATFLDGISPDLKGMIFNRLESIFDVDCKNEEKEEEQLIRGKANKMIVSDFKSDIDRWIRTLYYNPIQKSIRFLSKREMGLMAESMINLTSLRRRMSVDSVESVGGPVDVAIISKGDGLIWINRKHYFEMEKNPHFNKMKRKE